MPTVAVFGSSAVSQRSPEARLAESLGQALAAQGWTVLTGGYMGVMEAASRGARELAGEVVGVTCDAFADRAPNPYLSRAIPTPDLPERIATLMRAADAYVVLDGGVGTLAELFLALNLLYMGEFKPLVVVGEKLRLALEGLCDHTELSTDHLSLIQFVATAEEAVAALAAPFKPPA